MVSGDRFQVDKGQQGSGGGEHQEQELEREFGPCSRALQEVSRTSEGKDLKEQLVTLEEDLIQLTDMLQLEAQSIPNITHAEVPIRGEDNSALRKMVGSQREFNFPVKDHLQLGKELDLFDFDAAAEVSGSKFYYLKNHAVLLEMALLNWAISEVSKRGFTLLSPPEIVRSAVVEKCGFQPHGQNTQDFGYRNRGFRCTGISQVRYKAWMPGLRRYGEISNCTDYQSRRLGIRYRPSPSDSSSLSNPKKGKGNSSAATRFVHTLNATACAVPRMIVCLLENFQQEDRSVLIPEPLKPFMGGLGILSPKVKRW